MAKYAVSLIAIGAMLPLTVALAVGLTLEAYHEAVGLGLFLTFWSSFGCNNIWIWISYEYR